MSIPYILPINQESLVVASNILLDGGVVCIPTDTVYGLAAIAINENAVKKIFDIKQRPPNTPVPIFIEKPEDLEHFTTQKISDDIKKITNRFWPGALTAILKKSEKIPEITVSGLDSAGFRIPDHEVPIQLCKLTKSPITGTSANISGKKAARSIQEASVQFQNFHPDLYIDGGNLDSDLASTIVDFTTIPHNILREGAVSSEKIRATLNEDKS